MDTSSTTGLRQEIARKTERLEELRRARVQRQEAASQTSHVPTNSQMTLRQEVDNLVELLIGPASSNSKTSLHALYASANNNSGVELEMDGSAQLKIDQSTIAQQSAPPIVEPTKVSIQDTASASSEAHIDLDAQKDGMGKEPDATKENGLEAGFVQIPMPEKVTYCKEVQTDDVSPMYWELPQAGSPTSSRRPPELQPLKRKGSEVGLRRKSSETSLSRKPSNRDLRVASRELAHSDYSEQPAILEEAERDDLDVHIPELSEQEKTAILASEDFIKFFEQSTKFIERALTEEYDILADYTTTVDRVSAKDTTEIQRTCVFSNDKLTKNRSITDVDWSSHHAELLLGSYNKNSANINDPDGLVLVWNLHMIGRPEFTLQAQSDVMAARFSPFHHNLIVGGTYSGQIVIWDTRAKNTPVLKTSLSSPGHSHPVYSLSIVGTQNAHNLVTASTDGVMCTWQLDMLAHPQDLIELTHPSNSRTEDVAISCLAFPRNDFTTCWIGTEEGNVYQSNRYERAGSKAGIDPQFVYSGHNGMITGLDFHPSDSGGEFHDLFLTSSVDWTVKLWKAQTFKGGMQSPGSISCLHSFDEAQDYVFDVAWSPTHPAMFGSVDSSGRFDLYNLAISDMPIVSEVMPNKKALNKISWDKEGRRVGLASIDGTLSVYDIGKLCVARPEDTVQFQSMLKEFAVEQ
ncbi:hypothetical protein BASA62_004871 [Batrachochytrium salamandrivorans]|nr:hypothetical protein BASA62_004871 [Batrachochytrium salamandrivorans]